MHLNSYNYYYILGEEKRSLMLVAHKFNVSKQSVFKWSKAFNWKERTLRRDIEVAKRIEKKTNDTIVNTKANYREDIKKMLSINKSLINTAIKKGKLIIRIENVDDFKRAAEVQEKLTKVDLVLMGEASDRTEHKIEDIDLSKLSLQEKLKLKDLILKAQGNATTDTGSD
jgi:hypothetical protein